MAKNRPKTFNLTSRTPDGGNEGVGVAGGGGGVVGEERVVINFVSNLFSNFKSVALFYFH